MCPFKGEGWFLHHRCHHLYHCLHRCVQWRPLLWCVSILCHQLDGCTQWITHVILGFGNSKHTTLNNVSWHLLHFINYISPTLIPLSYLDRQTSTIHDEVGAPSNLSQYTYHPSNQDYLKKDQYKLIMIMFSTHTSRMMVPFKVHCPCGWVCTAEMNSSTEIGSTPSAQTSTVKTITAKAWHMMMVVHNIGCCKKHDNIEWKAVCPVWLSFIILLSSKLRKLLPSPTADWTNSCFLQDRLCYKLYVT